MRLRKRNVFILIVTSLIFGAVICPVLYIVCSIFYYIISALTDFSTTFIIIAGLVYVVSTTILISFLLCETGFERFSRKKPGRFFSWIIVPSCLVSLFLNVLILAVVAFFTLFSGQEYLVSLTVMIGISSIISYCVLAVLPPSRVEISINAKLNPTNKHHEAYRWVYVLILLLVSTLVIVVVFQY